jgi:hypothetical protein
MAKDTIGTVRAASCEGKEPFASPELAKLAVTRMRRRGGEKASAAAYRCQHCGQWHVGCTPSRYSRRRA